MRADASLNEGTGSAVAERWEDLTAVSEVNLAGLVMREAGPGTYEE